MANSIYRFRYVTSRSLGMFPSAEAYEERTNALLHDVKRFKEIEASPKLARFHELSVFVLSKEFAEKKRQLNSLTYKGSSEFQAEKRLHELTHDTGIKKYFSFKNSSNFATYLRLKDSKEIARFLELKAMLAGDEFMVLKREFPLKTPMSIKR